MTTRPHPTPAEEDDGCMLTNRQFWLCGAVSLALWIFVFWLGWLLKEAAK